MAKTAKAKETVTQLPTISIGVTPPKTKAYARQTYPEPTQGLRQDAQNACVGVTTDSGIKEYLFVNNPKKALVVSLIKSEGATDAEIIGSLKSRFSRFIAINLITQEPRPMVQVRHIQGAVSYRLR